MTVESLLQAIGTASWFTHLGRADADGALPWRDLHAWQDCVMSASVSGLLRHAGKTESGEPFDWLLPATTPDELRVEAADAALVRAAYGAVLARLGPLVPEGPWLRFGDRDLTSTAANMATWACGNAVTEFARGSRGFWSLVVQQYLRGSWPVGVTRDRRIVAV